MTQPDRKQEVLVAVQQALLGEVSPHLRAVTVDFDATNLWLKCYYDGEVDDVDRESMSQVETELVAYFPATLSTSILSAVDIRTPFQRIRRGPTIEGKTSGLVR